MDIETKVLDIFYNSIVPEAANGRINVFFMYNVLFNTSLEGNIITQSNKEDLIVPMLNIKDKNKFDKLLVEYVKLALEFYDDKNIREEILDEKMYEEDRICKEKAIIALLFANATYEDFENPLEFIQRRINFFTSTKEENFDLGYSSILNASLKTQIAKDIINLETPFEFKITITNGEETFMLPNIKFGISGDTVYIYTIQNPNQEPNALGKKVNRILYKAGEGFDKNEDNYEIYEEGNLADITSSFLVALNIFIAHFNSLGYTRFKACSILPERWNSKTIANKYRLEINAVDENGYEELQKKQELIQRNLTEKFIRTFLRIAYHYEGIDVISFPMELDSYLELEINSLEECNNTLLRETGMQVRSNFNNRLSK